MRPTLVLGIGNILLQDEGVGVRVVEAMQPLELPPHVEVLDGGTSGADLVDVVADRHKVIVIDAIQWDAAPGTVFRLRAEDLEPAEGGSISLHQLGLVDTLAIARRLNCAPQEVVVYGVQPRTIAPGLDLTPEVAAAIPIVIRAVLGELERAVLSAQ